MMSITGGSNSNKRAVNVNGFGLSDIKRGSTEDGFHPKTFFRGIHFTRNITKI